MFKMVKDLSLLAVLFGVGACSSSGAPVDIGDRRTGEKLEDYAANWQGYAEAHDFADGSDQVKITLDALGNGTLEIGNSPALPIATDPNVGYPANYNRLQRIEDLFVGVSYPVSTATVEAARIRFSVNPWDLERDWCALQTSYLPPTATEYLCVPYAVGLSIPGNNYCDVNDGVVAVPVDCTKRDLCLMRVCDCDAQGCSRHQDVSGMKGYTKFDAALDATGDTLVGTLKVNDKPFTVRLQRL